MITEDYVGFETAELLKEKGFDVYGDGSYDSGIEIYKEYSPFGKLNSCATSKPHREAYAAPTLQMAMKWLREVHNIAICICAYYPIDSYELSYRNNKPYWKIRIMNHTFSRDYDSFNTYEGACEAAIKYCLENLI